MNKEIKDKFMELVYLCEEQGIATLMIITDGDSVCKDFSGDGRLLGIPLNTALFNSRTALDAVSVATGIELKVNDPFNNGNNG